MPKKPRESRGQEARSTVTWLAQDPRQWPAHGSPRARLHSHPLLSASAFPAEPHSPPRAPRPGNEGPWKAAPGAAPTTWTLTFPSGATPSMRGVAARLRGKCRDWVGGPGASDGPRAVGAGPKKPARGDTTPGGCGASLPGLRPPRVGQAFSSGSPGPSLVLWIFFFFPEGERLPQEDGRAFFFFLPLN